MSADFLVFLILGTIDGLAWGCLLAILFSLFSSPKHGVKGFALGVLFGYLAIGIAWAFNLGIFAVRPQ